jgi:pimeloyl-ACP methyl ester carboxylesterase
LWTGESQALGNAGAHVLFGFDRSGALGVQNSALWGPEVGVLGLAPNIAFAIVLWQFSTRLPRPQEALIHQAPTKRFVWFEESGHMPMTEGPGKFAISLVSFVRPIAEKVGNAAP